MGKKDYPSKNTLSILKENLMHKKSIHVFLKCVRIKAVCKTLEFGGLQMKGAGSKNGWGLLLMLLAGIVLGGFIGMLAQDIPGLGWLSYGQTFGLQQPVVLDLGILVLTFGTECEYFYRQHCWHDSFYQLFIASYNLLNRSSEFTKEYESKNERVTERGTSI